MYEMLTGRVPFDADTPVSIALKHMQEKPIEPKEVNPEIPNAINKIILKAMEKEISLRYASATEMLKDLTLALKDPEGNFVNNSARIKNKDESYTRVLPTINIEENEDEKKEKGKIRKYIESHPKMKKAMLIGIICLAIILIPVVGFWGTQMFLNAGRPKDVNLPNLVGKTLEEAMAEASNAKLQLEIKEEFNDKIKDGEVISQEPPYIENYTVKENSTIVVSISKGAEMIEVPKLVGKSYDDAVRELEKINLKAEKIDKISQTVEKGITIEQEPKDGEKIKAGETVKLYVSSGNGLKQVVVQYVIGKNEKEAKELLTKDGLEVNVVYEEDTTKTDGSVLKQSIDAGQTVEEGTKVILTVNKIAKLKNGIVKINLKSLTGGITLDEEGNEIDPEVDVMVKVNEDSVYEEKHRKDTTDISVNVEGIGTIEVKVYVDGILKKQTRMNLNTDNAVWTAE